MTILFVGSAPSDLGGVTLPYSGTTHDVRDPNFTPVASYVPNSALGNGSAGPFSVLFENTSDAWIHYRTKWVVPQVMNTAADGHFYIMYSGATEIMRININSANPNILDSAGGTVTIPGFVYNTTQTIDLHVEDTGTGYTFKMYIGGALQVTHSWLDASVGMDRIVFEHYDFAFSGSGEFDIYYSEFIVTGGESTIGWRLATLTSAANGFHTAWEGGFAGVQELGDGQSISSDTANERETWTLSAYGGPATASGVRAVVNKMHANVGATGPQTIVPCARIGGVDYDLTGYTPGGSAHLAVFDNDPATGVTWDTATLATLEIGVKAEV